MTAQKFTSERWPRPKRRKVNQPIHRISAVALPLPPPGGLCLNQPVPLQPKARTCASPTVSDHGSHIPTGWGSGNSWVRSPRCRGPGARLVRVGIVTAPRGLSTSPFVLPSFRRLVFRRGPGSNVMFGFWRGFSLGATQRISNQTPRNPQAR